MNAALTYNTLRMFPRCATKGKLNSGDGSGYTLADVGKLKSVQPLNGGRLGIWSLASSRVEWMKRSVTKVERVDLVGLNGCCF